MAKMPERTRWLVLAGMVLILSVLACNDPERADPTVIPPTVTTDAQDPTATTASSTEEPSPTATTPVDVTTEAGCTLNAGYLADVTVPDDTEFAPGASFVKTWRLRNTGTCDWEPGTVMVFSSGNQMGGPDSVPIGAVAAGQRVDVSINLVAPDTFGTHRGDWQPQAPDGTRFGTIVYVRIVVPEPATATPTPTPTLEPSASVCVDPDPDLEPILDHANDLGYDIGCPVSPATTVEGAFQEFWANVNDPSPHTHYRSLMIWRSDLREVYVIDGQDTDASEGIILAYTDFWEESQPAIHPDCAAMTVPGGYELPVRGFGKLWCENDLWDWVGWPDTGEAAVSLLIQPTQTGLLMRVTGPIPISYLIALDYRAVYALTMMITP